MGPGESMDLQFGWRGGEVGTFSLDCEILTPTQLVDDSAFGGGTMMTESVIWNEPVEEEGLDILPILVALTIGIGIAVAWAYRRAKESVDESFEDDELDEY